jgi:16S rRNA (guanine966-N2)-methyltransferase
MRVIAGAAKGRRLRGPAGRGTRPTSDLVRGAIFDILRSLGADLSRVIDLYAGTGALGIEALSRGSEGCDFVERDRASCDIIRENLAHTGLGSKANVHCWPVEKAESRLSGPYSLLLADPPYTAEEADRVLAAWGSSSKLTREAVIVLEHSRRRPASPALGDRQLLDTRRHGDTCISIYR